MNPLLSQAISEVNELKSGEVFLVKELFKGYEWNRIDRSSRLTLGTLFLNEVKNNHGLNVEILDKTSSSQQRYMKK